MNIKLEFIRRDIAGETFLVPIGEASKKYSGLIAVNELGAFIWDALPEAENAASIVKKICEEYEVEEEEAAKDTEEFLGKLREMEIIE